MVGWGGGGGGGGGGGWQGMDTKCKSISRKNFKGTKEKCLDVTEG